MDDDFAVDDSQSAECVVFQLLCESGVDGAFNVDFRLQQRFEVGTCDEWALLCNLLVEHLRCVVEDVSEGAVVDDTLFVVIGFL